jgi:hypothetical protein
LHPMTGVGGKPFITTWTKLCRAAFVSVWCQVGTDWAPWRLGVPCPDMASQGKLAGKQSVF